MRSEVRRGAFINETDTCLSKSIICTHRGEFLKLARVPANAIGFSHIKAWHIGFNVQPRDMQYATCHA